MKRIYIAGPMTGLPDLNRAEFDKAERYLRSSFKDCVIYNPIEKAKLWGWTEKTSLRHIADTLNSYIVSSDSIYMLRGWKESKGATAEHAVAKWIGLEIIYQEGAE